MSLELSWPGAPCSIRLGAPLVAVEAAASAGETSRTAMWQSGPGHWSWSDGLVRLIASIDPVELPDHAWLLRVVVEALQPIRIQHCWLPLEIPCGSAPHCLDRRFAWRSLRDSVHLTEQTPLVLSWREAGRGADLRAVRGWCAGELAWRPGLLTVRLCLDAAALHPRWSFVGAQRSQAAPLRPPGERFQLDLLLQAMSGPCTALPVAGRFPAGAEAAFTITDHCDFDTLEALRVFLRGDGRGPGWVGRGLRLTKGVFTLPSRPRDRPATPSLADRDYHALICQLHADGSEIAPHGLNESGPIDRAAFLDALATIAREFHPRTWIDHGVSLPYCYSMGGADAATYDLLAALRHVGITALWAYHDVPAEPGDSLNLLDPRRGRRARARSLVGHLARGHWLVAAHYLRTTVREAAAVGRLQPVVEAGFTGARDLYMSLREAKRTTRVLQRAFHAARRVGRAVGTPVAPPPHKRDELFTLAPALYPERGAPARATTADEPLLFVTQEVVHIADAYHPDALQRLTAERGLHIGHCYLTNRLPYLAGLFDPLPGLPRLSNRWLRFLDALAAAAHDGSLWNPRMGELAEWLRILQLVAVVPLAPTRVRIENPLPQCIRGFTLLLPNEVQPGSVSWNELEPGGWRRWGDWLAVWGDLPPSTDTIVGW